jgi:SAM-dependent methyltransferase
MRHWQTGVLEQWLAAAPRGKLLSHGSGDGGDRGWLEGQGYDVTAFDIYPTPNTDVVADGHDLPFADGSFDVVTTIGVLQELPDPFRAVAEIARVLRPGGQVIGSVAFLEPFSGGNHFNMSHLGVRSLLERSGLGQVEIAPGWSSFEALSANFWVWGHSAAGRRLSLRWNRLKYRVGLGLLEGMYRLRGKPAPASLPYHFAGSLLFRAVR